MAEGDEKLEIEIATDKVSLRAEGDGARRLSGALADALSPFTQSLGALGDVIHYFRQENAIRALQSAKRLAEECGVDVKAVPPKFLVQWIEAASLEEPGPDDLSELWAGLLVTAGQSSKPTHLSYKRILGEITGRHVELLRWIGDFDAATQRFPFDALVDRYSGLKALTDAPQPMVFRGFEIDDIKGKAESLERPGVKIFQISTHTTGGTLWYPKRQQAIGESDEARPFAEDMSNRLLQIMGLLEQSETQINGLFGPEQTRGVLVVQVWHLTPLGLDFLKAVAPKGEIGPHSNHPQAD